MKSTYSKKNGLTLGSAIVEFEDINITDLIIQNKTKVMGVVNVM